MGDKEHTTNIGYIDDTSAVAASESEEKNCRRLALSYAECEDWARRHASIFAPEKFALLHFRPPGQRADTPGPQLDLGEGRVIKPSTPAKLLGVVSDGGFNFQQHLAQVQKRTSKAINAISSLGKSKWGLTLEQKRLTYNTCILPKMLYASSV